VLQRAFYTVTFVNLRIWEKPRDSAAKRNKIVNQTSLQFYYSKTHSRKTAGSTTNPLEFVHWRKNTQTNLLLFTPLYLS